jgi:hypothetical protein
MRRRLVLVVVLVVGVGASAVGALAAMSGGSGATTTLLSQNPLSSYQLASDAGGSATVMWTTGGSGTVIRVRQQNAQGGWSAPVQVGGVTQTNDAQLVVSASGAAAVVWYYVQGGVHSRTVLMVATRGAADGSWSAPEMIWSAANAGGLMMAVSSDATGKATVAWAGYRGTNPAIWVAGVNAADGRSGRPEQVVKAGAGGADLTLAENATGAAVLSWQRQLSPTGPRAIGSPQRFAEMAAQQPSAAGSWSAAQRLGTFSEPSGPASSTVWGPLAPSSVVTANGTAAVGWRAGDGESRVPLDVSTHIPGNARWTTPRTLSGSLNGFGLAAGANNELVAVWSTNTAKQGVLITATSTDATHWAAPAQLARIDGGAYGPILAGAANGRIAIAPLTGNHAPMQYAIRSPAGHWSALKRVGTGDNPEVAVATRDSVTILWETFNQQGQDKLKTRTLR